MKNSSISPPVPLTLALDAPLLDSFRQSVETCGFNVSEVMEELIRLFVRQSPRSDYRGIPVVGFLNLGTIPPDLESRPVQAVRQPVPKPAARPMLKGRRRPVPVEYIPSPEEIRAACDLERSGRGVSDE